MRIELTLNGQRVCADMPADATLYELLRAQGMKSVKCGCETTNCGLCTVHLNGRPVLSCSQLAARCAGAEVVTLEGLQDEARLLAQCLADEGAEQCGFCSPGLVMNVLAMARELRSPTPEQVDRYLAGNLCRCTGYMSQRRAIAKYLKMREEGAR